MHHLDGLLRLVLGVELVGLTVFQPSVLAGSTSLALVLAAVGLVLCASATGVLLRGRRGS